MERVERLGYSEGELSRALGLARRRLRRWAIAGILVPNEALEGRVRVCVYTREQAILGCALRDLISDGWKPRAVARAGQTAPASLPMGGYLVFDGKRMYARESESAAVAAIMERKRPALIWGVETLARRVSEAGRRSAAA